MQRQETKSQNRQAKCSWGAENSIVSNMMTEAVVREMSTGNEGRQEEREKHERLADNPTTLADRSDNPTESNSPCSRSFRPNFSFRL